MCTHLVLGIRVGEHPEKHHHHKHGDGIDLGHGLPTVCHNDGRCNKLGQRRTGITRTKDTHGKTLLLLGKPACGIGNADRKRGAGYADKQSQHQKLPVLGRLTNQVKRQNGTQHQDEIDDTTAVSVCPDTDRQSKHGAGQYWCSDQDTELGLVQRQQFLDRNTDNGKHYPHRKTCGEGKGVHGENG